MGNWQNPLHRQTAKFAATCIENLPILSGERMQYWIGNSKKIQTRLSILRLKKIIVIGNSLEFLHSFLDNAEVFLGHNLGADQDSSVINNTYQDSDRFVFINFSNVVLEGSEEALEEYGENTAFYRETRKFEIASSATKDEFELFIFDSHFLEVFRRECKEKFEFFMQRFEQIKKRGEVIQNQFKLVR